ncbi:MAG: uracil-DNA glycosylase [Planctomycetes bacterium]|nr:uracil-DNA glycosylase [Planctomycetota bacterium]
MGPHGGGSPGTFLKKNARRELAALEERIQGCRACPRLVRWREQAAREAPRRFRGEKYWARPVPGFGDPEAWLLVVGLAPAAHGGNRTGRVFTGDRSGDWLYRALFRAGLANQPTSTSAGDGLELSGAFVTAAVRCAPPENRPATDERDRCKPFLAAEIRLLSGVRVAVALGGFAFDELLRIHEELGRSIPRPRPRFTHGREVRLEGGPVVLASYHPSQQNTFTGRLTEKMFDEIFRRTRVLAMR